MKRKLFAAAVVAGVIAGLAAAVATRTGSGAAQAQAYPAPHPTVSDYQFIKATTPTQADCAAVARTCFTPQAIQSAYNVGPLHQAGWNGKGITIAIVDSYGSDTMAHDLHVFDQAFGLQAMCGEEGVICQPGMPRFSELAVNGTPRRSLSPARGRTSRTKLPGRSRSRSTSRPRTRSRRRRTSCSFTRTTPRHSASRASRT